MKQLIVLIAILSGFAVHAKQSEKTSPWLKIKSYKSSEHLTFMNKQLENIRVGLKDLRNKNIKAVRMVERLARVLAGCRHYQYLESKSVVHGKAVSSKSTLKLMQAHNLFESYIIAQILALDGNKDQELLAKILESRLLKTLPEFR